MIAIGLHEGNGMLEEHLQLLRSLAQELERAMQAISHNSLPELEDSLANQHALCARLVELTEDVGAQFQNRTVASPAQMDEHFVEQIHSASGTLQALNQRYSALLQHSSRSVEMLVSLFNSFRGQFQEGSGTRLKHQTWSCQI
jgi:flagellar biosynthesis/type III secretory pathway chaperone